MRRCAKSWSKEHNNTNDKLTRGARRSSLNLVIGCGFILGKGGSYNKERQSYTLEDMVHLRF
jgi:hypothetical protein